MSKIKNIFFDFGRTIVEHPEDGAGLRIVKKTGVLDEKDAEIIRNAVFSVGKYLNFLDEGSMSRDEYKRNLSNDVPEKLREFALKAADYHICELPVISGMEQLLQKLKNDGYSIYITSNLDEYHAKQMYGTKFKDWFDGMIFSSEVKVRKPYPGFFEAALKRFGVKAEECLFIDDLKENVDGAEACGIKGFVFKGSALEAERYIYNQD